MLSALGLAGALVVTRRAMHKTGEAYSPVPISAFFAVVFFGIILLVQGKMGELASLSWVGASALAGAGVVHFILGRWATFDSTRLIGANRSSPIVMSNTLIATVLGVVFFSESMTVFLVVAIALVIGGVFLISTTGRGEAGKGRGVLLRGVMLGLAGAVFWGVSPILVRIGLKEVGSPVQGIFVSFVAASVVLGVTMFRPKNAARIMKLDRTSLVLIVIGALLTSLGQLWKYSALDFSPVSIVIPLLASQSLIVLFLSYFVNRQIEVFHPRVIAGIVAMIAGVLMIFVEV